MNVYSCVISCCNKSFAFKDSCSFIDSVVIIGSFFGRKRKFSVKGKNETGLFPARSTDSSLDFPIIDVASLSFFFLHNFSSTCTFAFAEFKIFLRCTRAESTTHFSSALLFPSSGFSPLHSLPYSFYPLASAAIDQFKLLLTGSAGDLWLHLSRTWNPPPWGLAHVILVPLSSSRTFQPFLGLCLSRSLSHLVSTAQHVFLCYLFICLCFFFQAAFCPV